MYPLLSVIVPVYNTKDYLDRCVESILKQTYPHIEILLIDDGSEYSTADKCDKIASVHKNVKVFHKKNGGQATARNLGIEKSHGFLITFVDSDDYIADLNTYTQCINTLLDQDCDIIQYPHRREFTTHIESSFSPLGSLYFKTKTEFLENCRVTNLWEKGYITTSVCDKIFKKYVLDGLSFINMFLEDVVFIIDSFENAKSIIVQDKGLYSYCYRTNSTMTSTYTLKKYTQALESNIHVYASIIRNSVSTKLQTNFYLKLLKDIVNLQIIYGEQSLNMDLYNNIYPPNKVECSLFNRIRISILRIIGLKRYINKMVEIARMKQKLHIS